MDSESPKLAVVAAPFLVVCGKLPASCPPTVPDPAVRKVWLGRNRKIQGKDLELWHHRPDRFRRVLAKADPLKEALDLMPHR